MNDEFRTIAQRIRSEDRVRGSRFIATASPVRSRKEVEEIVQAIQRELYDATHHCFAYRLTPGGGEFRVQDDGEPSGSAGKPILRAIDALGLTDTLVVISRYFGGTKLGVGGLARAYGGSAERVLSLAEVRRCYVEETIAISFPHERTGDVMHVITTEGATIVDTQYDDEVHLRLSIRSSRAEQLRGLLLTHTRGNIDLR
jgi:uncharacterized YigZ family protein